MTGHFIKVDYILSVGINQARVLRLRFHLAQAGLSVFKHRQLSRAFGKRMTLNLGLGSIVMQAAAVDIPYDLARKMEQALNRLMRDWQDKYGTTQELRRTGHR